MKKAIEDRAEQERIAAIIPGFGDMKEDARAAVCEEIESISIWLDLSLDMKEKHENPEVRKNVRKELRSFEKKIEAVRGAFGNLTTPARREIEKRVSREIRGSDQENTAKLNRIAEELERLRIWVAEAQAFNQGRRGQPKKTEALESVKCLEELWNKCARKRPTMVTGHNSSQKHGVFLELCEAVIVPIYEQKDLPPPSIQSLVQAAIYPPKFEDK